MSAGHRCSFAWLCQWQKPCPALDNDGCVNDLSVLWLLIRTCLSQSKCVKGQCKTIWDILAIVFRMATGG